MFRGLQIIITIIVVAIKVVVAKAIQIDPQEVVKLELELELLLFQMIPIQDFIQEPEVEEFVKFTEQFKQVIGQVVQFIMEVLIKQVHY